MRFPVDRYPDDKKWFVRPPGGEGPIAFSSPTAALGYAERVGAVATDGEGHVSILAAVGKTGEPVQVGRT